MTPSREITTHVMLSPRPLAIMLHFFNQLITGSFRKYGEPKDIWTGLEDSATIRRQGNSRNDCNIQTLLKIFTRKSFYYSLIGSVFFFPLGAYNNGVTDPMKRI